MMAAKIWERFEAIEECYEFMLGYAARGVSTDEDSQPGQQIRSFLKTAVAALDGLAEACPAEQSEELSAFLTVLDRDARDSLAAMRLVLAQRAISSQLIDNLNASMHLRALLTDIFLLGEVFRTQRESLSPA